MTLESIMIAVLLGIVTNILTFFFTRSYTTNADRERFREEGREARENSADAAVGHLRSSYLAVKKLALDVREQQRKHSDEKFQLVVWGIAQSLEQIRLQVLGHLNVWRSSLPPNSDTLRDVNRFLSEDVLPQPVMPVEPRHTTPPRSTASPDVPLPVIDPAQSLDLLESLRIPPGEMLMRQLMSGDVRGLESHLEHSIKTGAGVQEILITATPLALHGNVGARDHLIDLFETRYAELDGAEKQLVFSSIAQAYIRPDREQQGIPIIERMLDRLRDAGDLTDDQRAFIYNQAGIVFYGAREYSRSLQWQEKAVALSPDNPSYVCNVAKNYVKLGDTAKATLLFERALALDKEDDADHLFSALSFYAEQGNRQRVDDLLPKLEQVDSTKARFFKLMRSVRGDETK